MKVEESQRFALCAALLREIGGGSMAETTQITTTLEPQAHTGDELSVFSASAFSTGKISSPAELA